MRKSLMRNKMVREGATRNKHRRHIPQVLIEKILPYLPVKSLFRFSAVSKSWNSMIFAPEFSKGYRGREMIVLRANCGPEDRAVVCPLSSLSSDNPIAGATPFVRPFRESNSYLNASCGHLWCVEFENSLILYNPSIRSYRKLPVPSAAVPIGCTIPGTTGSVYVYGLGYDSVSDDYKVVKIHHREYVEAELYSLASDCWKKVESRPPPMISFLSRNGMFVNGAVHWLIHLYDDNFDPLELPFCIHAILSFDLTTEQFGVLNMPKLLPPGQQRLNITVIGGKLCVYLHHNQYFYRFDAWVLEEDYGWSHEFEIDYGDYSLLEPFYFYDKHGNLIKAVTCSADMRNVFVYKHKDGSGPSTLEAKSFGIYGGGMFDTYVESFVSPWPLRERAMGVGEGAIGGEGILGEERGLGHGDKEKVSVVIDREGEERGLGHGDKEKVSVVIDREGEERGLGHGKEKVSVAVAMERDEEERGLVNDDKRASIIIDTNKDSSKGNHGRDIAMREAWLHRCTTTEIEREGGEIEREEDGDRKRKRISIIDNGESSKGYHGS